MPIEPPPLAGAPAEEWIVFGIPGTYLMWAAIAFAAMWLAATIFIQMRRRAVNLTSAQQASVKKDATPDFMQVDQKARDAAMQRGEKFEKELDAREAAEAAAGRPAARREPINMLKTISGIAAFAFSLFTLLGSVLGTFRTLDSAGVQLSKLDQVGSIVSKYPVPTAICLFVIGYTIYIWVSTKKWAEPPKI